MESKSPTTPFSNKCQILGDLWMSYRDNEDFIDFIEYNDLGLPLAYALANSIVKPTPLAEGFINESFFLFLESLGIESDTGFESLDELLDLE